MRVIPVLLYHGVNSAPSDRLAHFTITPEVFARHMTVLSDNGFLTPLFSDVASEIRNGTFESTYADKRVALVTFDDGWADFAESALPVMTDRGIGSTLYITSGFVSGEVSLPEESVLSWDQIRDVSNAGVEIGAHSHTHPQMDTLLPGRAWEELTRCKAMIEDAIGKEVPSFAYPHGYNSPHLRGQVQLAGYKSAAAVREMLSHTNDDTYRIARLTVTADTTLNDIEGWIYGEGAALATPKEQLKTRGWRAYRFAKAIATNKPGNEYAR